MIDIFFEFGNDVVLVNIKGNDVKFGNTMFGAQMADISGMKLNYDGVCKEHPDLATADNWRELACERFKEKINGMPDERSISDYVIHELESQGYVAIKLQRNGFRPVNLR